MSDMSSATGPVPNEFLPPSGYPPQGPADQAPHLGYPQMPMMPHGYIPPGYPMPPPGYGMPPGYPPGYAMPPGYAYPPGYAMPHGYPAPIPPFPPAPLPVAQAMPEAVAVAAPVQPEPPPASPVVSPPVPRPQQAAVETVHREPVLVPSVHSPAPVQRSRMAQAWQRIGGGSLTLSILIHAGILILAGLVVFTTALQDKAVDFLPGGGSQQGQEASQSLEHQVRQKKRSKLNQSTPKSRLVSTSINATLTLPEAPPDMLDLPDTSSMFGGGGKLGGNGGFGSGGMGGGFGSGLGVGGAKGFTGMTLFGKLGGEGMPGVFYDMKQTPDRAPTALTDLASEADFANVINEAAGKKFSGKGLDQFFHSTQKMSFTYLLIPYMAATEGPKAFKVENEVQPRAWMVHYAADVRPPAPGEYYRFVGMFDDALIVYVNGKPVLDGSWYPIVDHGEKRKEEDIRQDFGGPIMPGSGRRCYAGKWVKMDGLTHIDIVVGERPGGRVGGLLLVQAKKGKYAERADGTPILPVFSTSKPTLEDQARIRDYTASGFEVAEEPAVFTLTKDVFGGKN